MAEGGRLSEGLKVGLRPHLPGGPASGIGSIWQRFPLNALELNSLCGFNPNTVLTFNEAAGNFLDSVGADPFRAIGGVRAQASPFAGELQFETLFASGDSADALNVASFNYAPATSFAWMGIVNVSQSAGRAIWSRRTGAALYYQLLLTAAGIVWTMTDGIVNVATTIAIPTPTNYMAILTAADRNAQTMTLAVVGSGIPPQSQSAGIAGVTSTMNAGPFSFGQRVVSAPGADFVYAAETSGVVAEGLGLSNLQRFWRGI